MKQITQEIRQRIFALYWGQAVLIYDTEHAPFFVSRISIDIEESYLYLTPLHLITDEDAICITQIIFPEYQSPLGKVRAGKRFVKNAFLSKSFESMTEIQDTQQILQITDLLRSRGYALPYLNYTVDDLVEDGVFKLKTEVK